MLQVRDLVAGYGDIPIVRGVSLEARKSEITSIIGPNGAGKSTLLKTIFNLIKPMGGRVLIDGVDVTGLPSHKLVSLGVSFLMQRRTVFPELTVEENLEMALWKMRGNLKNRRERLERVYEVFPAIARLRSKQAYLLSGGEQRQVELARIFLQEPKIVLVDEPTVGLSPKAAYRIYEMLTMMKGEVAVLMVDQNIRHASQFSDKLYVMVNGVITMEGSRESLSSSLKEIVKSWLRYT